MLKTPFLILVTVFSVVTASSARANPSTPNSGMLIWTPGNNFIYKWDASTGRKSVLLKLPHGSIITSLTKINSRALLFSAYQLIGKNVDPYNPEMRMYLLNLKTKKPEFLHKGLAPTYIAQHHKLFFIGQEEHLLTADFDNASAAIKNIREIHSSGGIDVGNMPGSVIQVSADEVIFYYQPLNNGPNVVLLYNLKTDKWKPLPLKQCMPLLWRAATQQLLCSKGDSFNYFLTGLKGGHMKSVGHLYATNFFVYLPEADAALAIRPGSFFPPEREDIWIYYFKSGGWTRLVRHAGAPPGGAIWIQNRSTAR